MASIFQTFAIVYALASTVFASPATLPNNTLSEPIPPSRDPFYTAPPNFESSKPGEILRLRHAPGNLSTIIGNCSAAYNILYRTTDARYKPSWAVTTLYTPKQATGTALLSIQFPYNTPDLDFSPSYDFYSEPPADVGTALGRGWFVNVPDHEGPYAADGANVGDGYATLDSVRAALATDFGLDKDAKYALWGYSGGALASEWAAELQVQYAPEMNFSGMAIGGTPQNITSVWEQANGTPFAGMIPLSATGVTKPELYPEARQFLLSQLKPEKASIFLSVENMGFNEAFAAYSNQSIWDTYFINGKDAFLDAPVIQKVLDSNFYMGYHGVPQMPVFMYQAIHDQLALVQHADALRERFCGMHVNILMERNTVGDHLSEYVAGVPRAMEWLSSVLDGSYGEKYNTTGCTVRNVTIGST